MAAHSHSMQVLRHPLRANRHNLLIASMTLEKQMPNVRSLNQYYQLTRLVPLPLSQVFLVTLIVHLTPFETSLNLPRLQINALPDQEESVVLILLP